MLIQKGITRALFQALYMEYSEETPNVELLLKIHQVGFFMLCINGFQNVLS